ncbi:hypothetical protein ACROYT_G006587 [Oculina patagonica]
MISLSALTFMRLLLFYSDTHVRLTGHNVSFAGRVEVFAHGVWGRVLSNHWGQTEAAVVCRQLGFPGVITALKQSSFGEGSGPVVMSNVQCTGTEKTLQQCQYDDWPKSDIYSDREVGVICKTRDFDPDDRNISIHLQGSSVPNAGRVEVLYAGVWGAISRDTWDINDATVVCQQLGYQAGAESTLTNVIYGPISGPVWITNLQCSGRETNVMKCSHDVIGNKSESQSRRDVASVICKDGSLPNGMSVRLRGSHSINIGRVEVYYSGKWGTIHNSGWDINDATVVCRQLGYSGASLSGYGLFCSADVPNWFRNFRCYGNESSLDQCAWDFITYSSYRYCADVVCSSMADSEFKMRLSGSPVPHAGRVEFRFKGVWGTIGSFSHYYHHLFHFWYTDPEVTRVICRQLNFADGILATNWPVFGRGTGPQWFYNYELQCLGDESNLLNCSHPTPHLTRRSFFSDLGVVCKPDVPQTSDFPVRLNGSNVPFAGTIEVMYQGVWGGVLGRGYRYVDINVGHVVCRQLGYSGADEIFNEAVFGQVKGPLWIWRIQCSGNETKISDCAVTTWDNATNTHPYYQNPTYAAGVLCNETNSRVFKDLKVRLAGAPISNAGRVEVFYAGVWGTVARWGWDMNAAHVVCRQLGYPGAISSGDSNQFGVGTGPVWFTNVRCLGNESSFGECLKDAWNYPNGRGYSNLATVLCKLPYRSDNFPNCSQVACANNGTCFETAVGAICNCTDGLTGVHCEIPAFNPCQSSPCKNGGKCFSNGSSYLCACPKGLTGQRCEQPITAGFNPCLSRPCPNNTSCHDNKTHYSCVPNDIETIAIDDNGTRRLKNNDKSTTTEDIFNTPFIVLMSVSAALIVILIIAVVYMIFRNRRHQKHQPNNPGTVFSNMAYKGDPVNNFNEEEAYQSNDVDLGTGITEQKRQDSGAIYEEASRPLPPIPVPHNTARKEEISKPNSRSATKKANITSPTRAGEEHYMGLSQTNVSNTTTSVAPRAVGTYSNSYMSLTPVRPADTSYSSLNPTRVQTPAAKQHRNKGNRREESHQMYENTGK